MNDERDDDFERDPKPNVARGFHYGGCQTLMSSVRSRRFPGIRFRNRPSSSQSRTTIEPSASASHFSAGFHFGVLFMGLLGVSFMGSVWQSVWGWEFAGRPRTVAAAHRNREADRRFASRHGFRRAGPRVDSHRPPRDYE